MIGHLPTPGPDELLYSICARFASRVVYPDKKSVLRELFGASTASAVVDLPNRLGHLAASLPQGTSLTINRLIDQFTLFAIFSAFIPPGRVKQLRSNMGCSDGPAAHLRSGMMASRVPALGYLRFCPACRNIDKETFGEPYWHRLHQLPGVEVCPSHHTFLEDSGVRLRAGRRHLQFISAEQVTRTTPVRHVDTENREHLLLLQVARDAQWLLEHPTIGTSPKALHIRYLRLLIDRGLATYTGSIHVKKLLDEFSGYYSPSLLKLLNCELRGQDTEKTNWLLRLVRLPKHTQHPLYHLLLIQFLGCTVEEFFQLPEELHLFGEGPWPCLNLAADHYKQSVIVECRLGERLRYGKPTGKFSCVCGFAYARTGPDTSPADRFRVGRVISFGRVWEAKLKQLCEDPSLSISEIGKRLGVDPLTVRRHVTRLRLPFTRSDKELKPLTHATQLKGKAASAAWEKKRHGCRSKWLSAMKHEQQITLKALRCKLPREYAWLRQNDSEWLEGHKPRLQRRKLPSTSVDWKRRDAEYAVAVGAAASRLKNAPGRPVRVTRTAIGRALGAVALLRQKLDKMPLTAQVLNDVVETREQYAVRRVWRSAELYRQEGILPRRWQLILRANVYNLSMVSAIKYAVGAALQVIESKLVHGQSVKVAL